MFEMMRTREETVGIARKRTAALIAGLKISEKRDLVREVQQVSLRWFEMTEAHLFRVKGYLPCTALRPMVTILLRRHKDLQLPEEWVIAYLWLQAPVSKMEEQA